MGKYEAAPQKAASSGGKKKHIGLWITLAVLMVIVAWGVWFFTTKPSQEAIGDPSQNQPSLEQPDSTVQTTPEQPGSDQQPTVDQPNDVETQNPPSPR